MRIQPGHAARVFGPDGGDGEPATVVARPAQVDTGSATADVRLSFRQATHITSGTAVRVDIAAETKKDVLVVPADAVMRDGDETFVFVAGADGKAQRRSIDVGLTTPELVEIRSGVSAGDRVITHGQAGLPDGAAITVGK
jgi:multidrug efflux pump subunit AcrA (membrane-fusion protein)